MKTKNVPDGCHLLFNGNQASRSFRLYGDKALFDVLLDNAFQVVVSAEILPRDLLRTLGNYYFSLTIAKIQRLKNFIVKKFRLFLRALTVKLLVFKNKRT